MEIIGITIISIFSFMMIFIVFRNIHLKKPIYSEVVENINICSLQDNSEIEGYSTGTLFAQSGKVNQKLYYKVMLSKGNKKRYYKIEAKGTDIYEINSIQKPHIEVIWQIKKVEGKIQNIWLADKSLEGFSDVIGIIKKISLYVPEKSIDNSFKIDFKD